MFLTTIYHRHTVVILVLVMVVLKTVNVVKGKDKKQKLPMLNLLENQILDSNIRTVEFYLSGGEGDVVDYPIISLDSRTPIVLEFDWMADVAPYMNAKIIHCDYDWSKSSLMEMDYLQDINEFPLRDLELSSNTFVPYTHLKLDLPFTRISGNFVLQVYDEGNKEKVYLTRRFIVFDNKVKINSKLSYSNLVSQRFVNHQLDFSFSYSGLEVTNPVSAFQVAILQNGRWDNVLTDLIPTSVREDLKTLKYDYFSGENNMEAGNEFRAIDLRSNKNEGLGVRQIDMQSIPRRYTLYEDLPKRGFAYSDSRDMNGKFVISNFQGDNRINSDYVQVHFSLKTTPYEEPVYIFGGLSDWKVKPRFRMEFDSTDQIYRKTLLLKQGYYNYLYALEDEKGINISTIDGSHQQTANEYILLIYVRRFGFYYDEVVGYTVIK